MTHFRGALGRVQERSEAAGDAWDPVERDREGTPMERSPSEAETRCWNDG
ncbi:hypothetical protein SAMN02745206_01832 [Desulfacinum infernum DSM 9756]|uniref:Uncharacterized protein n=1 Tax=Desulfacinum infernum DSM 9756 TaxID=1121391 RepID=A0A1M5B2Y5_9BACT|nr:hypothetical protein SAMN02745206_01832 [Desulfacinum infernum DSM 9756]